MRTLFISSLSVFLFLFPCFADDTGAPTNFVELNRWYAEPPEGQNAATVYLEAFDAMKVTDADNNSANLPVIGKAILPLPDKPIPTAMAAAITEFAGRNQAALDLFEKAAGIEQSRYPTDLSRGAAALLPHLSKIKRGAQVIELCAISHALAGDGRRAGQDVLIGFALANSLQQEPILISQLVRIACTVITVNGMEQTFNRAVLPSGILYRMEKKLVPLAEQDAAGVGIGRAFVWEKVMGLYFFDLPPEQQMKVITGSSNQNDAQLVAWVKTNSFAADRQLLNGTFDAVQQILKDDYPERLKVQDAFERGASEAKEAKLVIASQILPAMSKAISREAGGFADLELAQTAIALERFRAGNDGHYPDSLSDLTPGFLATVPSDPFDGKNLRYRRSGNGYVLSSIGQDRKDDGGMRLKGGKGDLVFSVVNPPKPLP